MPRRARATPTRKPAPASARRPASEPPMPERPRRTAFILIIGDEILSGEVSDENAAFLAKKLTELGMHVVGMRVVPDTLEGIAGAVQAARAAADLVIATGGIGPTHDDVTRQAIAQSLGVPCERHPEAELRLRRGYGATITDSELEMADLPRGSRLLTGSRSGAYGFAVDQVHVLPGIPSLLREIFAEVAAGWESQGYFRREFLTALREGHLAPGLREIQAAYPAVAIGSYPIRTEEGYRVRIVLRAREPLGLDEASRAVEALLGSR
jgi:molybdenum cofactor synthesis domain-containing protein